MPGSPSLQVLLVAACLGAGVVQAVSPQAPPADRNPCDVLTAQEVAAATGLTITRAHREPSIKEVVAAQREERARGAGSICVYDTPAPITSITLSLTTRTEAAYHEARDRYFRAFPGSADDVPGLGRDAWIGGGGSLQVLGDRNVQLMLSTQMYDPRSREILVAVARAALARLQK
jgi:hypothetical protein